MSRTQTLKTQQNDPAVVVPAAIRAASARADALHQQEYNTKPEGKEGEPKDGGTEGEQTQAQPPAAEPATPPKPEPAAPASPPASDPENFEHKYHSLKGRYDQQERIIQGLRTRVTELEAKPAQAPKPPEKPRNPEMQFKPLTKEERESYGDDFIDVAARAAAEHFVPTINDLRAELDRVNQQLTESQRSQGMTAAQMLSSRLDTEVPNWRDINRAPKFFDWLALQDPYSGATRKAMLMEAHQRGDAQRVIAFFKGFLADEATTDPAKPDNAPPAQPGKPKLEDFAAPGRAKAPAATPAPGQQKETISRRQIANFYKLVNAGHYRGNEQEKNRLEQMIFDAEREGLIVD